jgi:hypothetical protein
MAHSNAKAVTTTYFTSAQTAPNLGTTQYESDINDRWKRPELSRDQGLNEPSSVHAPHRFLSLSGSTPELFWKVSKRGHGYGSTR